MAYQRQAVAVVSTLSLVTLFVLGRYSFWTQRIWTPDELYVIQDSERVRNFTVHSNLEYGQNVTFEGRSEKYTSKDIHEWMKAIITLHDRFKHEASDLCNNTCVFKDWICNAKTKSEWEKIKGAIDLTPVPLLPKGEYVFPWDAEYLGYKPIQDIKTLPDLERSEVFYMWNGTRISSVKTIKANKNEMLIFRADLIDSYGNPRPYGGDEVRTWISDSKGNASTTGRVKDLGNGTYLLMVTPKYPGVLKLNVAVTYPREAIRAALHHRHEGRYRFMFGLYSKGGIKETTLCQATPNIPGRPCICNHTQITKRPYYCGRPQDSRLQCKDWSGYTGTTGPIAKDYTTAEAAMAAKMSRKPDAAVIKHDLVIHVGDKGKPDDPLPTCIGLDRRITWNKKSPRGIWINKEWHSFICKEPKWTSSWVHDCLRSTHVWMFGDSNMKMMYNEIRDIGNAFDPTFKDWKLETEGHNIDNNSTLTFRGHELPNFHIAGFMSLIGNGGIEDFLHRIPSTGNHIVVIHYFLHFTISDLSAIFRNLVATRDAVSALLSRSPNVLVGIRGPHTAAIGWPSNHLFGGDVLGSFVASMLDVVFKSLRGKIVFLDGWDMTISIKNLGHHPPKAVPKAMLRTLFSFKCPDYL